MLSGIVENPPVDTQQKAWHIASKNDIPLAIRSTRDIVVMNMYTLPMVRVVAMTVGFNFISP